MTHTPETHALEKAAASLAVEHGRPTRAKAFEAVRRALHSVSSDESDAARELMHIYAYFMPAPPKKPKTAFDWVAAAVATDKNELRQYLRFVRIFDNGDRVATDGKRLHLDRGTGDAPGWYAPNGSVTAAPWEGCEYPDYQVPVSRTFSADRSVTTEDQARWERFPNVGPNGKRVAVRVAELSLGDGLYLDDRYLQAALQGFSVPVIHYDSATPDNGVAITEYGDTPQDARRIAVIMPFRL